MEPERKRCVLADGQCSTEDGTAERADRKARQNGCGGYINSSSSHA